MLEPELKIIERELSVLQIGFGWRCGIEELPELCKYISVNINGYVWSEKLGRKEISYPKDWWEALKLRFAPKWFLKQYPVIYTKHILEARALFPNYQHPPEFGRDTMRFVEINSLDSFQ